MASPLEYDNYFMRLCILFEALGTDTKIISVVDEIVSPITIKMEEL